MTSDWVLRFLVHIYALLCLVSLIFLAVLFCFILVSLPLEGSSVPRTSTLSIYPRNAAAGQKDPEQSASLNGQQYNGEIHGND